VGSSEGLGEAQERILAGIRLVALDVDGTLTDGRIVYSGPLRESGREPGRFPGDPPDEPRVHETQAFHVHDGHGLTLLRGAGVQVAWITGRGSQPTRWRAQELGVTELLTRSGPKDRALALLQERLGIPPEHTAAMGDDLPDLAMRARAAFFAAPADARPEVLAQADLVTVAGGGQGAVRELAEAILGARGRWPGLANPG
jgi:3-deoxy-D-manno-octulosonate 8-phosphate phosphatase (KDO 8-P phosphatase)